jgi:amino acid permease
MGARVTDTNVSQIVGKSSKKRRVCQILIDVLVISGTVAIFGVVYKLVDPKIRYFYCNENDIFHPYIKDTIPYWVVAIFGFAGPITIIILVEIVS